VSAIVRFGDRYAMVEEAALAPLRNHVVGAEITQVDCELSQGDQVRVIGGAFGGLEAVVTQVLPAKQRVKVLMDFLGRQIEAEIEHARILRPVAHPLAV
jgi:transcriptional antiterminator RfaH